MAVARALNLGLAFACELAMLGALAWCGFSLVGPAGWAAGLGAPAAVAAVWGAWLAPRSVRRLPMPWLVAAKLALYGGTAAALGAAGRPGWGAALLGVSAANLALAALWRQDGVA